MSDTTTPILGLAQPLVGGSSDTWGNKQNTNETIVDNFAGGVNGKIAALEAAVAALQAAAGASGYQEPVGTVKWWPADGFPPGYLLADGTVYPMAEFPQLGAVLSSRWGGDGINNFGVPDLRGFVLVGFDLGTGRTAGQYGSDRWEGYGGSAVVTLQASQVPAHAHGGYTDWQGTHYHNAPTPGTLIAQAGPYSIQAAGIGYYGYITDSQGGHYHAVTTDTQGGSGGHTNCQPGVLGYWIIKAERL